MRPLSPARTFYPSISTETPALPQQAESAIDSETGCKCEQSFVTAVDVGGANLVSQAESLAALDTGATANLARFSWLANRNSTLVRHGIPRINTYPSTARSRFGDGRLGKARHAADIPV